MKKSLFVTLAFVSMIIVSLAFTKHDEPYKNLKILPKDITEKQMDSVMHHYTASLNVKCNFCHVKKAGEEHPDFASDDNKHKLRTREMMLMTDSINQKYFDLIGGKQDLNSQLAVTCYTCHHGSTDPATKPVRQQRSPQQLFPFGDSTKRQ